MLSLIGLHGGMGCGKSEAFKMIQQLSKREVVLVKFAGPLYAIQEFAYNTILPVYQRPADFIKDRTFLQWVGTEWGRNTISENIWVDLWLAETGRHLADGKVVVCDDVRFDNEGEIVRSLSGKIIHIKSDFAAARINTGAGIKNHSSEAGLRQDLIDVTVENNATLQDYKNSLSFLCQRLGISDSATSEHTESAQP